MTGNRLQSFAQGTGRIQRRDKLTQMRKAVTYHIGNTDGSGRRRRRGGLCSIGGAFGLGRQSEQAGTNTTEHVRRRAYRSVVRFHCVKIPDATAPRVGFFEQMREGAFLDAVIGWIRHVLVVAARKGAVIAGRGIRRSQRRM